MGVNFAIRCPWTAPAREHRLDQSCTPDCPIADLHTETLDILKAYPSLGWFGQPFYGRGKDSKALHIVAQDQSPCSTFTPALLDQCLLEITQELFAAGDIELADRSIYMPETLGLFSKSDGITIARWNDRVLRRAQANNGFGKEIQVPILPIQVIWLHEKLEPSHVGDLQSSLGPLMAALSSTGAPMDLLDRFCYHWDREVQTATAVNRSCPDYGKVAVALLHADIR